MSDQMMSANHDWLAKLCSPLVTATQHSK